MAHITLINPPYLDDYTRNSRCDIVSPMASAWYPLWLGQAGCYLEGKGHQTQLIDAQTARLTKEQAIANIESFHADWVAVYTGRLSEESDAAFGDALAKRGFNVVFVGSYASSDCAALLNKTHHAHLAIQREFDLPLEELANGADAMQTPNVWVKDMDTGALHNTPARPFYKREILDQFPLTSAYFHKHLNIGDYRIPSERYPYLDLMSGRGCSWGRCAFCLWTHTFITGSTYNTRSIEHFMQEFDYIRDHMPQIKSVMIQDDMLTNNRAAEISEALIKRNNKIRWSCYAKPNSKMTDETMRLMKRSGCLNLHVGFESGNNGILQQIDKGTNVDQSIQFADQIHKAGLRICGEFTFGHYGDTVETMRNTVALAKRTNPHLAHFLAAIPLRGTPFWDKVHAQGTINASGQPSYEKIGGASADEIATAVKNAYKEFYFSPRYWKNIIRYPNDLLFKRLGLYGQHVWRLIA